MRFMLLVYDSTSQSPLIRAAERAAWRCHLTGTGEWISGRLLADSSLTLTVLVSDGAYQVSEVARRETGRVLIGCFEVECDSYERAVRIAAAGPWPPRRVVEVRPVMDDAGREM